MAVQTNRPYINTLKRDMLGKLKRWLASRDKRGQVSYAHRLEQELAAFAENTHVHDLPEIFHYWSNRYVRPWFEEVGTTHPEDLIARYLLKASESCRSGTPRFLSIGSGNCDAEVMIARDLIGRGLEHFTLECLDINPKMLERGRALAKESGVAQHLRFLQSDFNHWQPDDSYDGVVANQCLHHVQNLEGLFDSIHASLNDQGLFITSDMIGRNGHQRWPEALEIVEREWAGLADSYKYNHQNRSFEMDFVDPNHAVESFEGIRAQDVLPLLVERFSFHVFIAFGNVVDIFIDRAFGHNFSVDSEEDKAFIDRLHAIDEEGFKSGLLTPTHMVAVLARQDCKIQSPYFARGLSPRQAIRTPD